MNRWKIGFLILVLFAVAASLYGAALIRRGFSAREKPSTFEETVARAARDMARPSTAKNEKNPFPPTQDILEEARRHFADHCATCHANDGSGQTEIGRNLYPKPPDMRLSKTQELTDGQLYYIIHNGVRLTGMPAWGESHEDDDSWKLVLFVRHLPRLTDEEKSDI
jgi:mono/diheme cytochrome c family protein